MGTPDFALPTLHALHQSSYDVPLVVTQPDRPKGRGRHPAPPPIKRAALQMGYAIAQPTDVREPAFVNQLTALKPDFLVVVAYGQILPDRILKIPRHGALNVHASLLPRYRGPAPIQWAIMRGETQTGVTTMLMDRGVDTGDTLLRAQTPIHSHDTAATLHDRLAQMGGDLLVQTLAGICQGTVLPRAQQHAHATYAPMLQKTHGRVEWHKPAAEIDAMIRAMTPWPGAFCLKEGKRYKIHKACPLPLDAQKAPGSVTPGFPDELRIATGNGVLSILEIQGESGKRMQIKDFLRGHPIAPGETFE
jgi:methionyl-tRNA formyltransferase